MSILVMQGLGTRVYDGDECAEWYYIHHAWY